VRLDSGDLASDSAWVRQRLDQAGWNDVIVFASGDLDEDRITSLLAEGARIDGFGVGTALVTSNDSPTLGVITNLWRSRSVEKCARREIQRRKSDVPRKEQVYRSAILMEVSPTTSCLVEENFPGAEMLLDR